MTSSRRSTLTWSQIPHLSRSSSLCSSCRILFILLVFVLFCFIRQRYNKTAEAGFVRVKQPWATCFKTKTRSGRPEGSAGPGPAGPFSKPGLG